MVKLIIILAALLITGFISYKGLDVETLSSSQAIGKEIRKGYGTHYVRTGSINRTSSGYTSNRTGGGGFKSGK